MTGPAPHARGSEQIAWLLEANRAAAREHQPIAEAAPSRRLAVVTCMDTRIDVLAALGLRIGEAHVIRNAGARVTDDVLRSLALSTHVLGVDSVIVMQHTKCGLAGATDEELQRRTGAPVAFFSIEDHEGALREDIESLRATPYLGPLAVAAGFVYDVDTGVAAEIVRWERPS